MTKGGIHAFTRSLAAHLVPSRRARQRRRPRSRPDAAESVRQGRREDVRDFGADTPMQRPAQPEEIAPGVRVPRVSAASRATLPAKFCRSSEVIPAAEAGFFRTFSKGGTSTCSTGRCPKTTRSRSSRGITTTQRSSSTNSKRPTAPRRESGSSPGPLRRSRSTRSWKRRSSTRPVRAHVGAEIMDEADEEHHVAKVLIAELDGRTADAGHRRAKFVVLAESVRHHIREEEDEMLPKAKELPIDFEALGTRMLARKKELKENGIPAAPEAEMVAKAGRNADSPAAAARRPRAAQAPRRPKEKATSRARTKGKVPSRKRS